MLSVMEKLGKRIDKGPLCYTEIMSDLGWFQQSCYESLIDVVSRQNKTAEIEPNFYKFWSREMEYDLERK